MTEERIKRVRKLIEEFEDKHTMYSFLYFNEYMECFNNHSINDIQDFMWDMYKLIEDIKFRIPKEGD